MRFFQGVLRILWLVSNVLHTIPKTMKAICKDSDGFLEGFFEVSVKILRGCCQGFSKDSLRLLQKSIKDSLTKSLQDL